MRKVKFNKFIPAQRMQDAVGSGYWEEDYTNEGMFTGWGTSSVLKAGWANVFTVAMIELPDGTIEQVLPERIKFVNPSFIEKTKLEPIQDALYQTKALDKAKELVDRMGVPEALYQCDVEIKRIDSEEDKFFIGKVKEFINGIKTQS